MAHNRGMPRLRNAISRVHKFQDCVEHIHMYMKIYTGVYKIIIQSGRAGRHAETTPASVILKGAWDEALADLEP